MTDHNDFPTEDSESSILRAAHPDVSRRSVLRSLAAAGLVNGSAASANAMNTSGNATSGNGSAPANVNSWRMVQSHETIAGEDLGSYGGITHRNDVMTVFGLQHSNTRIPDPEDVAAPECNGEPGIQHRFVAASMSVGQREQVFDYDNEISVQERTGLGSNQGLGLSVTGPENNACDSVGLSLNHAYQTRLPLSSIDNGSTKIWDFEPEEIESEVSDYFSNTVSDELGDNIQDDLRNPKKPTEEFPWMAAAQLVFDVIGVIPHPAAKAISVGGNLGLMLIEMHDECEYTPTYEFEDNRITLNQEDITCGLSAGNGDFAMNFIDFTVTVPPNQANSFEVTHQVDYSDISGRTDSQGRMGGGGNVNTHVKNSKTWNIQLPSIDLGNYDGYEDLPDSKLPHPETDITQGPDPEIVIDSDHRLTRKSLEMSADCDVDPNKSDTEYRWRVYKRTGTTRPAVFFGKSFGYVFQAKAEEAKQVSAYGPGVYIAELYVSDEQGRVGADEVEFELNAPAGDQLPIANMSVPEEVQVGQTVTLDASESIDIYSDRDSDSPQRSSERIQFYLWTIVETGTDEKRYAYGRTTEWTFEEPGDYSITLDIWTLSDHDWTGHWLQSKVTTDGRPTEDNIPDSNAYPSRVAYSFRSARNTFSDSTQTVVTVGDNEAPTAAIDISPSDPEVGDDVTFSASASEDTDGYIQEYNWTIFKPELPPGDTGGAPLPGPRDRINEEVETFTESLGRKGDYRVDLEVIDDKGTSGYAQETLTVESAYEIDFNITGPDDLRPEEEGRYSVEILEEDLPEEPTITWGGDVDGSGSILRKSFEDGGVTKEFEVTVESGDRSTTKTKSVVILGKPAVTIDGDSRVRKGDTASFSATVDDPDGGGGTRYMWDLIEESKITRSNTVSHTYRDTDPGNYEVAVTAFDDDEQSGTDSMGLEIVEEGPIVAIDSMPSSPQVGESGRFVASVDLDSGTGLRSVTWEFGDRGTETGGTVYRTFQESGEITVTVTATDKKDRSDSVSATLDIQGIGKPTVSVDGPTSASEGDTIELTASAEDPDGGGIKYYSWASEPGLRNGDTIRPTFTSPGKQTFTVTAVDDEEQAASATHEVTVDEHVPSVRITKTPSNPDVGETGQFKAETEIKAGDTEEAVVWNFGGEETKRGKTVYHTFQNSGTVSVSVTVRDEDGQTGTDSTSITVGSTEAPVVSIDGQTSANEGDTVELTASAKDPDGGGIRYYNWESKDGLENGPTIKPTFDSPGDKTFTVTAVDDEQESGTASHTVTVDKNVPTVRITNTPSNLTPGDSGQFKADVEVKAGDTLEKVTWSFGDGDSDTGTTVYHTYTEPGDFKVTVEAEDEDGNVGKDSTTVTVDDTVKPEVSIDGKTTVSEGKTVDLTASANDPDGGGIKYFNWDSKDGLRNGSTITTGPFTSPGERSFRVTVVDDDEESASASHTITVSANVPTVEITDTPSNLKRGDSGRFEANAEVKAGDTLEEVTWDFGDGDSDTGETVSHTYTEAGDFTVTVEATDEDGNTGSDSATITVKETVKPEVTIDGPTSASEGDTIELTASANDPDGGGIKYYNWESEDGLENGPTINPTFTTPGEQTFRVTAVDDDGESGTASHTVTVDKNVPTVRITNTPSNLKPGDSGQFKADVEIKAGDTLEQVNWDFGDGDSDTGTTVYHTYTEPGDFKVTVKATDEDGNTGEDSATITVDDTVKPEVSIDGPTSASEGDSVSLEATASDPDGGGIKYYNWESKDGLRNGSSLTTGTFTSPGERAFTVSVVDDDEESASASHTVNVSANVPSARITNTPSNLKPGDSGQFKADVEVKAGDTLEKVTWDFGDGDSDTGTTVYHTYTEADDYTVTVEAKDEDGNTGSDSTTVTVSNIPKPDVTIDGPTTANEGDTIELTASTKDSDGGGIKYFNWESKDGIENGQTIRPGPFSSPGKQTFSVTAVDNYDQSASASHTVNVSANVPSVQITNTPSNLNPGDSGQFKADVDIGPGDTLEKVTWDFGDGESDTGTTVYHSYTEPGDYTVTVEAKDEDGNTGTDSRTITVDDTEPPNVSIDGPTTASEGDTIELTASANDPDGGGINYYNWESEDGIENSPTINPGPFSSPGKRTFTVTAVDDDNESASASHTVNVSANVPSAEITNTPSNLKPGDSGQFSATVDIKAGDTLEKVTWDFGDGDSDTGKTVYHSYSSPGDYTVTVEAKDEDGNTGSDSRTVTVDDTEPPNVSISGDSTVPEGESVTLTASANDPDGGGINYYNWESESGIENGSTLTVGPFDSPGQYTYTVTAVDDDSQSASESHTITVTARDPSISITSTPSNLQAGDSGRFEASASFGPGDTKQSIEWSFGDGGSGSGETAYNTYNSAGSYNVSVTATDDDGNTDSDSTSVSVSDTEKPTVSISGDNTVDIGETASFSASANDPDGGGIRRYNWNIESGIDNGSSASTSWDSAGSKTVTVTVVDDDGESNSASKSVTVENSPPSVSISGPDTGSPGQDITLTANASDPDGNLDPNSYSWSGVNSSSGNTATVRSPVGGVDIEASVTVEDTEGASDSDTHVVSISGGGGGLP